MSFSGPLTVLNNAMEAEEKALEMLLLIRQEKGWSNINLLVLSTIR